jgi:hypothetical protein
MGVMDEFKEERDALKHGTWKQKLSYFWDYFKWRVIACVAILFFVGSFLYSTLTSKSEALSAAFINAIAGIDADAYLEDFAKKANIDTNEYEISVDSSLYMDPNGLDQSSLLSGQKIMANVSAKDLDLMAGDLISLPTYAYQDILTDLRTILTAEELEQYQQYLFYIDGAVVQEILNNADISPSAKPTYPDPTKPEKMKDPIPVAIFANASVNFSNAYFFTDTYAPLGIVVNTTRKDLAVEFLRYVLADLPVTETSN